MALTNPNVTLRLVSCVFREDLSTDVGIDCVCTGSQDTQESSKMNRLMSMLGIGYLLHVFALNYIRKWVRTIQITGKISSGTNTEYLTKDSD